MFCTNASVLATIVLVPFLLVILVIIQISLLFMLILILLQVLVTMLVQRSMLALVIGSDSCSASGINFAHTRFTASACAKAC